MFGNQFKWNVPNNNANQQNTTNSVNNNVGNSMNNPGNSANNPGNNMNMNNNPGNNVNPFSNSTNKPVQQTAVYNGNSFGNNNMNNPGNNTNQSQTTQYNWQQQQTQPPFQPFRGMPTQQGNTFAQQQANLNGQNGQQQPANTQNNPQTQQKPFSFNNNQTTDSTGTKPIISPSIQNSQSGNQQKFPGNNPPTFGFQANPQQNAPTWNFQQQQQQNQQPPKQTTGFQNQQWPPQQQQVGQQNNNKPFNPTQPVQQQTQPFGQQQFNNQNQGQQQNLQQQRQPKKKFGFLYCHFNHAYDGILDNKCSQKFYRLSCGHEVCLESMKAYLELKFDMKGGNELFMSGQQTFQIYCPLKLQPPLNDEFNEYIYDWSNAPRECNHILTYEDLQQFRNIKILENFDFIPK